ncbi:MAG: aminoacyl-tRNA hydrolase, partial [Clostridiales bacterium]|nr:aminoacyl-tRNA hydrolase [Clostridiales bacterium]
MEIFIVVGLGNPGDEYKLTRHNMGFCVVDALRQDYGMPVEKARFKALVSEVVVSGKKIVLVKPQTYMNDSGQSVREVCDWYKIPYDNLIIVYDDIDIEWKKLRVRPSGSAGSHNGLKSVVSMLNNQNFLRVRVGIGKPPENWDLVNYVLGKF